MDKKIVPKPVLITPRFGHELSPMDTLRTQLYEKLMGLRNKLATYHGIPPYMVITEQTLMQLAATLPSSIQSLR